MYLSLSIGVVEEVVEAEVSVIVEMLLGFNFSKSVLTTEKCFLSAFHITTSIQVMIPPQLLAIISGHGQTKNTYWKIFRLGQ